MKIKVEFLITHKTDIYEVGRIPCVGELVVLKDECHEVKAVIHILDALVPAVIRVK